jgi:hypothetical protein
MLAQGGVCGGAFTARRLPARATRRRCMPTPVQAAAASDAPSTGAAPKRKPTRKRMIDAMLREAEARKGGAAVKAPPDGAPRAAAAAAAKPKPKRAPAPAQEEEEEEEEEVLDLSAYLGGSAAAAVSFDAEEEEEEGADEEGTADSFGGVLEDEDEDAFDDDGPDFLTAAVIDEPGVEQEDAAPGQRLVNTWQYDSDVGEVVFKRVPQRKPRPSAMASSAALEAMLARLEADEAADSDGEADFDPEERELDAELRVPTALQKVDTKDVDEVITALSGMNTMFLDKESQALLDEELARKKKARGLRMLS